MTSRSATTQPVADVDALRHRIDAEFSVLDDKIKRARAGHLHEHRERQERLAAFEKQLVALAAVWKPRLEALAQRFGEQVKVTPHATSSGRQATFEFQSELARIRLQFSASTDREVGQLILDYDLEILPVLIKYDRHAQAEWPLDAIDKEALEAWIDDRIIDFVKVYLSLYENEYYLKGHMVVDPIAGVRFPKFAAAAKQEWQGKTYYFISEETQREFEARNRVT
jgi:YHS domain-containing protein